MLGLAGIAFRDKSAFLVLFFDRGRELAFSTITGFVAAIHFPRALAHGSGLAALKVLELVLSMLVAFRTIRRNRLWNIHTNCSP